MVRMSSLNKPSLSRNTNIDQHSTINIKMVWVSRLNKPSLSTNTNIDQHSAINIQMVWVSRLNKSSLSTNTSVGFIHTQVTAKYTKNVHMISARYNEIGVK